MFSVLIIDDEEPLREAITILGNWEEWGVSEVLEAVNGAEGLAVLRSRRVDIALIDMKMPELEGDELLRIVEEEFPDLLTIVISGYNDFEYARQAIRSGVVDYLLKPVKRADLNAALGKATGELRSRKLRESEAIRQNITLNMSLPKLKEKTVWSILERSFKPQGNEQLLALIGGDGARFTVCAIRALNHSRVAKQRFHGDRELLHFAVANVIGGVSDGSMQAFGFANPKEERQYIAVFAASGDLADGALFHVQHYMKRAAASLHSLLGLVVAAGVGAPVGRVTELAAPFEQAKSALDGTDLLTLRGSTVATGPAARSPKDNPSLMSRMSLLRSALESGNVPHAKGVLQDFTRRIKAMEGFGLGEADRTLGELTVILTDIALALGVPGERLQPGTEDGPLGELRGGGDFADFEQFEELLCSVLDGFARETARSSGSGRADVLADIKAYIDAHYFENMKVSTFTDKYFLSREYLMKLFKARYGYGIHEYVQKVRMDKAKELLADESLKIQDISEMLGYKDKNYFSKAFRNYCECSPSEFRAALGNKGE